MAAARKKSAPKKAAPKKAAKKPKAKAKKPAPRKPPTLTLVLDEAAPPNPALEQRANALAWFANLSNRIAAAGVPELQTLIGEARAYDLVGLSEALGDDSQVLALNKAANELIEAGLESFGAASPQGFQLQVLRDILNDS
jgi:hypothetical protein